ncbi:MAG: hypothetical protein ACD_9C00051G0008 [uncultured bacterium]|nr:MAG: hypothetical protein ACD_9C00051G0008 [uncultured bacterium]
MHMDIFKKIISVKNRGFTLVELMLVISIIGILAGVVLVSSGGGVEKSKRASAITTMSSILPELVICADDGGFGIITEAPTTAVYVCCNAASAAVSSCNAAGEARPGHTVKWPDIETKTGYTYQAPTNALSTGDYEFTATKDVNGITDTIRCRYAENGCS